MPEEIDGIVVTIRGDASDLETTINNVSGELSKIEKIQGKSSGAGVKSVAEYRKQMTQAENTLKTSRAALNNTKKAYEDNQKSITKNISSLKSQKSELDKTLALRINEKNLLTEANKHLDKNSTAYKDNQKAIKWVNAEIGSYAEQGKKITDSIRTQESALAGSKQAYADALSTVDKATKQYEEYEKGLAAVERAEKAQNLQNTGKSMKELGEGFDTITKPLQYTAVALAAGGVASAKFAIDFEDSFASVKKTVDGTPEQLDAIKKSIIDMSTVGINGHNAIPMTTDKLNELAAAGGQLGITVDNIADFTEVMAQMETATNLAGEEGAATMARFQNVMGISQSEIRNVGSAIVDLGNNSATTESEIAAMALRMGKYGQTVGMSAADVLGYSAALSSLGIEAQLGGSAIGRTWLSIESAVAHGGEELQTFAKYSGKSAKEFKEQWNTDSKGAFNGLLKGLQSAENLTLALDDLGINNTQDIQAMMALVNGYDLVTESVNRANTAYKENTALQEEFNSKAETTASQLAVAKQNIIEAARSIGETMLPTIKDASVGVAGFAKNLASMSDGQKKALVGTGATVIALGALSKGAVGAIKGVGGLLEGIGKIKSAMTAGGALAKLAPMLGSITTAAGPAALAVVGITAAVIAGKTAYDTWYNSNYKFADKLYENAEQLKSYQSRLKELNDLQWEYNDLTDKITSKNISDEELKYAQTRLNEIKTILQDKYKIDIDSGDIDKAVEKAEKLEKLNFYNQKKELRDDVENLAPNYERAVEKLPKLEADYAKAEKAAQLYGDTLINVAEWQEQYDKGIIDSDTYTKQFTDALNKLGKECGKGEKYGEQLLNLFSGEIIGGLENPEFLSSWLQNQLSNVENELNIEGIEKKIKDAEETIRKYKESVHELAAIELSELKDDFADGVIDNSTAGAEIDSIIEKVSKLDSGLQKLHENEKIDVKFNMDTGGLDIFDLDGNKLGEITANGKINWESGELPEIKDQDGKIIYYGDYSNLKAPTLQGTIEYTPVLGNGGSNFNKFGNTGKFGLAKGTQNFPGGLAMVNDERGISDNRELIVDRGRAFIPEGRDVILPLSRGAKVYTAAQTKAIMSGLGIPHYAKGKDNSDAFTAAKDDWTQYKNTHAVTVTQELQKWVELLEKFTSNQKDVQDIQEQIFSLMQKQTKELNDQAKAYLEERSALNDWEDIGDSPLAAFGRVKDRNMEEVRAGRQTWDDYAKTMKDIGSDMYNARISQSKKWLDHEEKYNGMSVADALAGIDRMREYTKEYYEQGIISHREFVESKTELDEMYIDKYKEGLDEQHQASLAYIGERAYFNDWETVGDDPERAYNDTKARLDAALAEGKIQWEEYVKYKEELDNTFIDSTNDQSYSWLDEQRKYFGMSDEEYAVGLERVKKRNEDWYANGIGTARKYHETISDLNHKRWDEASEAYDDMLKDQQDYINKMQEEFQKQEQALRDSWEVEDRKIDMATVQGQLDIYAGAVTDRGQQKYKELEEQMKQLQRDEELYQLQVKNTATIDALQADYETAESMKADYLKNIVTNTDINVSGIVGDLTSKIAGTGDNITNMLGQLLSAFQNFKVENNSMTDNRKFSYNISQMTPEQIQELCNALVGF